MSTDEYRARMETAHREFTDAVVAMLGAYGRTQTIITELLRDVDTSFADLKESNDELRRLILDQGAELRALREMWHDRGGEA